MPILLLIIMFFPGCYVIKQGYNQMLMLYKAQPIEYALRDSKIDQETRKKLELVISVRKFAHEHVHLKTFNNYKDVNLDWHKVMFNVSACEPLAFKSYEWWFPIIGYVPYKGFFNKEDANAEQIRLEKLGLEVQLSQIGGYSSLGFFADPLWPSMLKMNDYDLADLIFHELLHSTIYINNHTSFNESLASFVAKQANLAYFNNDIKIIKHYENKDAYQQFFYDLYSDLEFIYNNEIKTEKILKLKQEKLKEYEIRYQEKFKSNLNWRKVNNAFLMSFKRYNSNDANFLKLFNILDKDFSKFLHEIDTYARYQEPFLVIQQRIKHRNKT